MVSFFDGDDEQEEQNKEDDLFIKKKKRLPVVYKTHQNDWCVVLIVSPTGDVVNLG